MQLGGPMFHRNQQMMVLEYHLQIKKINLIGSNIKWNTLGIILLYGLIIPWLTRVHTLITYVRLHQQFTTCFMKCLFQTSPENCIMAEYQTMQVSLNFFLI